MVRLPRLDFSTLWGLGKGVGAGKDIGPWPLPPILYPSSPNRRFAISAAITIAALRESGEALPVPARL